MAKNSYRQRDETNTQNLKMIGLSVFAFFACIVIIVTMSVIFGLGEYSSVVNPYDRPAASYSYHDHRL